MFSPPPPLRRSRPAQPVGRQTLRQGMTVTPLQHRVSSPEPFRCGYKQVGPLSQAIRAAACVSSGENITAKSVHLTSLYPTALTSTNDHSSVLRHYVRT